jgi:3-hydroxyacyl-[acyl-carrier-protein] dehydratase
MTQPLDRAIRDILPHRYPFLFLDRITEFVPGERISGIKRFSADDEVVQGQPAGAGIVPLGILLEVVTQLGAVLVMERPQMESKVAVILQIPSAQVHELIEPGSTLRLEAQMVKMRENFGELRGTIHREERLVAEGHMRFGVAEKSSLQSKIQS